MSLACRANGSKKQEAQCKVIKFYRAFEMYNLTKHCIVNISESRKKSYWVKWMTEVEENNRTIHMRICVCVHSKKATKHEEQGLQN